MMYFLGSWEFHLFVVAFLCAMIDGLPIADPNINITISVPASTSDHGDPNLLCTPIKWLDLIVFFLANYFAHATTMKALPRESTRDFIFTVLVAIMFPFSGVTRGIEAIVRHASLHREDLQRAVRAGALYIIVRNEDYNLIVSANEASEEALVY